jgi:MFS family permease
MCAVDFPDQISIRVLQGLAGGGLAPVSQAILVDTFPPAKRASAFALYTIVIETAPAIRPREFAGVPRGLITSVREPRTTVVHPS